VTVPARGVCCVLLVDDSATVRAHLRQSIEADPRLHVVGEAPDGEEGLRLLRRLRPDIVVLDVDMPRMDGVEFVRRTLAELPTPVVLFASASDARSAARGLRALEAGALELVEKPRVGGTTSAEATRRLLDRLHVLAGVRPTTRPIPGLPAAPHQAQGRTPPGVGRRIEAIAFAASTGGPAVLAQILRGLPRAEVTCYVAQHMTPGFVGGLASWLDGETALEVRVAARCEVPRRGCVYLAGDGCDLHLSADGHLISDDRRHRLVHPSCDELLSSVARRHGAGAAGVILTGMGDDGLEGMRSLYRAGARTLAQEPTTCVVGSMPQHAIDAGCVNEILSPERIASRLALLLGGRT
jgi:two-component system, chemotaxis family, protein-glutamate methylesterase/glutaminase